MITNFRTLVQYTLVLLVLASPTAFSQKAIFDEGVILNIDRSTINIRDMQHSLLSTTHVIRLPSNRQASISDIKPGDNVRVKLIKIAKKYYVDTIYLLADSELRNNGEEGGPRP